MNHTKTYGELRKRHLRRWVRKQYSKSHFYGITHDDKIIQFDRTKRLGDALIPHINDLKYVIYYLYFEAVTDDDDVVPSYAHYPARVEETWYNIDHRIKGAVILRSVQ